LANAIVFLMLLSGAQAPASANSATETITAAEIQAHINFLAADALQGRDSGYPGAEIAAQYIATQFSLLGFQPAAKDWQVAFPLRGAARPGSAALQVGEERYAGDSVLGVAAFGGAGRVSGKLVVAGAEDVRGRIVLADGAEDPREAKKIAREHLEAGAAAVLLTMESSWLPAKERRDRRRMGAPRPEAAPTSESAADSAALENLPNDVREEIRKRLADMGLNLDDLQGQMQVQVGTDPEDIPPGAESVGVDLQAPAQRSGFRRSRSPAELAARERLSAPVAYLSKQLSAALLEAAVLQKPAELTVEFVGSDHSTNVVALVEGADPELKKEFVVLGAHYDHVGADGRGNIWNGADDNASGTASLLEIADALSRSPPPRRSILLAAWGAEERGLVGSRAFAADPPVPFDHIVTYVNLDMVSRNDADSIDLCCASAELKEMGEKACEKQSLRADEGASFYLNASDTAPFVDGEIPTLFFFSGTHEDYHQPGDDPHKVDASKAGKVARAALDVIWQVANAEVVPSFEKPQRSDFFGGGRRLGVVPSQDQSGDGFRVGRVQSDSVAAAAGLQVGDRILRIGESDVGGLSDLRRAIRAQTAKQPVDLFIRRGDEDGTEAEMTLQATFPE
jgi:Zn-dependent M28 family amino/carboxypeptidase